MEALGIHGVHYIFCLTNVDDHMENMAKTILPAFKPLHLELFYKSVTFSYELMYTRSVFQTEDMASQHAILMQLSDWVEEGKVRSTMTKHLSPLSPVTLKEAYENLLTGRTIEKIVVEGPIQL
ncbi:zinc-binding dehydrogenase [Planococcus sp. ISL-110]|uniref:zinc-binding dehydrogenase n=1 Tax=Planococcus sp. ISL-110 TaxID=2819167 RepID=UPI0020356913|nr:zinc-binding dehydrogenase [Planococcus sp. ISL-110]